MADWLDEVDVYECCGTPYVSNSYSFYCPKCRKIRLTNIAKKELSCMLQNVKFKKEDKYV